MIGTAIEMFPCPSDKGVANTYPVGAAGVVLDKLIDMITFRHKLSSQTNLD